MLISGTTVDQKNAIELLIASREDWSIKYLMDIQEEQVKSYFGDIIWKAKFKGKECFVFIIFEFLTKNDKKLVLRILNYVIQFYLRLIIIICKIKTAKKLDLYLRMIFFLTCLSLERIVQISNYTFLI